MAKFRKKQFLVTSWWHFFNKIVKSFGRVAPDFIYLFIYLKKFGQVVKICPKKEG
jgi:hypothetical protein